MSSKEKRFVADSMLGKLAKWLRVMGIDTHYQPFYEKNKLNRLVNDGFILLSRDAKKIHHYPNSVLILSDLVRDQLQEMRAMGYIPSHGATWFTRCLLCNHLLKGIHLEDAREDIPEYIYYQNVTEIRFCPSCGRYFWPGSHRRKMIEQLKEWGFGDEKTAL